VTFPTDTVEDLREDYRTLDELHEKLKKAVVDVLQYRVGTLPEQGWLQDSDASRKALESLAALAVHFDHT
jgi:hypothetical protein